MFICYISICTGVIVKNVSRPHWQLNPTGLHAHLRPVRPHSKGHRGGRHRRNWSPVRADGVLCPKEPPWLNFPPLTAALICILAAGTTETVKLATEHYPKILSLKLFLIHNPCLHFCYQDHTGLTLIGFTCTPTWAHSSPKSRCILHFHPIEVFSLCAPFSYCLFFASTNRRPWPLRIKTGGWSLSRATSTAPLSLRRRVGLFF